MNYFVYDKKKNLVTLSNAILNHFTGSYFHDPNEEISLLLKEKPYEKIIVFLFDGMGKTIQDEHLNDNDFIKKHNKYTFTSIFPPTTVAATTSFLSGKYPVETGWLGWMQYFPQYQKCIEMFTNCEYFDRTKFEKVGGKTIAETYCGYTSIIDLINDTNKYKAEAIFSIYINGKNNENIANFFQLVDNKASQGLNFIYAYETYPDSLIHQYGIHHPIVRRCCKTINKGIASFAKKHKDWLIFVIADHSLINIENEPVTRYEDFYSCLLHNYSLDSRSCTFFIKEGMKEQFLNAYEKYYQKDFKIFTKQEVIENQLFGEGEEHPLFKDFLGDYLLTSISKKAFIPPLPGYEHIGAHAGSTKEEYEIYVSIINK